MKKCIFYYCIFLNMQGRTQIFLKIAENMIDEYSYWMVICFFCIKEIV